MDKLLELLLRNPIILFLVGAWVIGMITNVVKAKKKANDRRRAQEAAKPKVDTSVQRPLPEQRQAPVTRRQTQADPQSQTQPQVPTQPQTQAQRQPQAAGGRLGGQPGPSTAQSPEQIAREMRRILGIEPDDAPKPAAPSRSVPKPTPPPLQAPAEVAPVNPRDRRMGTHVDPHVGEGIRDRQMKATKVGQPRGGRGAIGNLGGRVKKRQVKARVSTRFSLDDLRKAIVINEILSPPVSVRSHEDRRPG